ncbi:ligase-associated DNA damage response DEXH box helicase [Nitrospirillum sp. BR 11163]|uniref:ligase-associated DNA damage response DEXH box helicase n=1 Tax=Nitrospirillum sp. BR 11163 TaxID=3104323 RepID=UPI002AFFCA50|nr:ligase-associated DNA damage response DEXH box helicase [Nitrospirillum sp. BR 11163]MEA1675771.1 ligase-associated DNA damage response DEXH box helicase [Nitrospirillum sp. BR 11163]
MPPVAPISVPGPDPELLPANIAGWFAHRGWTPHAHQLEMLRAAQRGEHTLLIAPTGGGKTLAGFLPSLIDLSERPREGLHTLYISPLKALAVDIARNLEQPVAELRLPIRVETRTGDTPEAKRRRQRAHPPQILMTTVESLALLLSYPEAATLFGTLRTVIVDELHALAGSKRGDLLALHLARLASLAPHARRVGLSATVAHPQALADYLALPHHPVAPTTPVGIVRGAPGAPAEVGILLTMEIPWGGHMALQTMPDVYEQVKACGTTLIFVNTRAQAELVFQELWRVNADALPIALHHGSLSTEQRRKVEAAMARGALRAVVATSSLDLGIDWAAVDLVVQIGAPKGVSRLLQRIGRANHRIDLTSRALLVPANRFEVLECKAAIDAVRAGTLDGDPPRPGGLEVLAQHVVGTACAGPFDARHLFAEVTSCAPYAHLTWERFEQVMDFVATGGYALRAYERFQRLRRREDGLWQLANYQVARQYRLNVGTIVEEPTVKVRMSNGGSIGDVEEYFIQGLVPGDTFIFGGQLLRFVGMRDNAAIVVKGGQGQPKVPVYAGGRLPLTTHLADRVRAMLADPGQWRDLPAEVAEWLRVQRYVSALPDRTGLLVETFPRGGKEFLVAYTFEGRNAHQTLGMLLTRRMERLGLHPLGFVATDYVLAIWSLSTATDMDALFAEDMLGDDLEEWMDESSMLRRTFQTVATIAGTLERRHPGEEKTKRQMTVSADLIYDVLRRHDPGHLLLQATRAEAAAGLTDVRRLADMLARVKGRIRHMALDRISPLAVPVLLEIGRVMVGGRADEVLLQEAAEELAAEALPKTMRQGQGLLPF